MGDMRMYGFNGDYNDWAEDFDFFLKAKGLDSKTEEGTERCLGLFIHYGGAKIKEVYKLYKDVQRVWGHNEYQHARAMVDLRLMELKNSTYETYMFRNLRQKKGELFKDYVHRCEVGVKGCAFNVADTERHIRDQIVFGTNNDALREKAISENLLLKELYEKGNAAECTAKFSDLIQVKTETFQANAVSTRPQPTFRRQVETRVCYKCGLGPWPHTSDCPAKDNICEICKRTGHVKIYCRNNPNGKSIFSPDGRVRSDRDRDNPARSHTGGANAVFGREGIEENQNVQTLRGMLDEDLYAFRANVAGNIQGKISVMIDNVVPVRFLPDTGASVNMIDRSTYDILCQAGRYPLFRTNSKIYAYGSDEPLKLKGYFNVEGCFNNEKVILLIFVLDAVNCGNLLSKKSCAELGVIKVYESVCNISGPNSNVSGYNTHVSGFNHSTSGQGAESHNGILNPPSGDCVVSGLASTAPDSSGGGNVIPNRILKVLNQFPEGIGRMKGVELKIKIDETVRPVIQPPRRIPLSMRQVVEEKIEELLRDDIIEKADGPTTWLSPVHVVKQTDKVRMVVDMSVANTAILRSRRTLRTPEEIFCELGEAKYFSKVDLNSAYHQISLHPDSRYITAFSTHIGTYRWKRVFFGMSNASEDFDDSLAGKLSGLLMVMAAADDILVWGRTREEHDDNLHQLLVRLLEAGLTINRKKCVFGVEEVSFFGHYVSAAGVRPMINDNLREIKRPQTKSEVRSYMGLVNFIGKYIPGFSTTVAPISGMLSKTAEYSWGEEQERAFQAILKEIKSPRMLSHFDPKKETEIIVDASPVGLCAILAQEDRAVLMVSRKLSKVETRYSQTEREALAVVWACERLNFYLYGIFFTVRSDHKPLEILYSPRGKPAARILRWYIRLLPYRFEVKYRKGVGNPADYFSRKPVSECSGEEETLATEAEYFVNSVILEAIPHCLTLQEITVESLKDKMLQRLVKCVQENDWRDADDLSKYKAVSMEIAHKNGIVMRGKRIILPHSLRPRAIRLAHGTHMGRTKTKQYMRGKLWWPSLDSEVESMVKECGVCQAVNPEGAEKLEPLRSAPFPERPFSKVHIDLFGPLSTGETILGIVDEFSKWPELYVLNEGTKAKDVISALDDMFSRYGNTDWVVSDRGPQFISWEFENYMESKGIRHHLVTSLYPQANSCIERFFRNLKKFVKVCELERKSLKEELAHFLRVFRNTPSRATGRSPASLVLNFEPRIDFPVVEASNEKFQGVKEFNAKYKLKMKQDFDKANNFRYSDLKVGEKVLMRNTTDPRKHAPVFFLKPFTVTFRQGNQVRLKGDDGTCYVRPLSHVKKYREPTKLGLKKIDKSRFRDKVFLRS